ncbi:MAG TPA: 16S rRNA (adenine(1518)-N(6)/adenine(1519)-N(6))-dimethyltransferase RsmA [Acidimicrobiales bacterium]
MTLSGRQVRDLLTRHGLAPSRALGQNFVADPNTVRRIAHLAGIGPGDRVVEIGAGLGSLTLALAETGAGVTAIETDRHLIPVLREVVESVGVRVVHADARAVDWTELLEPPGDWVLVANLPYNIATSLVLDVLERVPTVGRLLVMVQREVGERLAARVGDDAYGIPSVKAAWWADAAVVGRVPATVFVPQPRVESALVRLVRHDRPSVNDDVARADVFRLIDAGFGQRRKMLRRSLAALVPPEAFVAAGVRPEARAEELTLDDWILLGSAVQHAM